MEREDLARLATGRSLNGDGGEAADVGLLIYSLTRKRERRDEKWCYQFT